MINLCESMGPGLAGIKLVTPGSAVRHLSADTLPTALSGLVCNMSIALSMVLQIKNDDGNSK